MPGGGAEWRLEPAAPGLPHTLRPFAAMFSIPARSIELQGGRRVNDEFAQDAL